MNILGDADPERYRRLAAAAGYPISAGFTERRRRAAEQAWRRTQRQGKRITAMRLVKASFNAHEDGYAGIQQLAHDANLLFYGNEEAAEGREAFKQKRAPDFSQFPRRA